MASPPDAPLQFEQLQSAVEPEFWEALGAKKLDEWKLSEAPVEIQGFLAPTGHAGVASPLRLTPASLAAGGATPPARAASVPGTLYVVNSLDRFKAFDWGGALSAAAGRVWEAASGGGKGASPLPPPPSALAAALGRFVVVAHADLKTYRFTYWVGFPAVKPPVPVVGARWPSLAAAVGGDARAAAAVAAAADGVLGGPAPVPPAFCVTLDGDGVATASPLTDAFAPPPSPAARRLLAFFDTAAAPAAPGWPLRNLLLAASAASGGGGGGGDRVTCVGLRARRGAVDAGASVALTAALAPPPPAWPPPDAPLPAVGWEVGPARGGGAAPPRPAPRVADLGATLDPARLSADAVTLNLRLMRWRAATDLDPGLVSNARFLLIGAGTLGCAVARGLVAWGVTAITLIDAGVVSPSNPARQSLYVASDAAGGGAPKAATAAAALAAVTPGVAARGLRVGVPMPGHPPATPADEAALRAATATLVDEVEAADCVMLLTDTRESRWLPTLLCAAASTAAGRPPKLAITAAIGFDTYVVMRHGVETQAGAGGGGAPAPPGAPAAAAARLGCYFCADVVAPTDSTRDRALDQQCTVSRPGLAPLAAALAVELAAAVLTHPARAAAPPPGADPAGDAAAPLGPVPHQLRGRLGGGFAGGALVGGAARQCVACSAAARAAWRARGVDLVLEAAADPAALERLTGLDALHAAAEGLNFGGGEGEGGGGDGDGDDDWLEL